MLAHARLYSNAARAFQTCRRTAETCAACPAGLDDGRDRRVAGGPGDRDVKSSVRGPVLLFTRIFIDHLAMMPFKFLQALVGDRRRRQGRRFAFDIAALRQLERSE